MNPLIIFVLVIVLHFRLNEACKNNTVTIYNKLTPPSRILKIKCFSDTIVMREEELINEAGLRFVTNKTRDRYIIDFKEWKGESRRTYKCDLQHGPNFEYFFNVQVYRGASKKKRCGETREWFAKTDAIYFRKNGIQPIARALSWQRK